MEHEVFAVEKGDPEWADRMRQLQELIQRQLCDEDKKRCVRISKKKGDLMSVTSDEPGQTSSN